MDAVTSGVVGALVSSFSGGINIAGLGDEVTDVVLAITGLAIVGLFPWQIIDALVLVVAGAVDAITVCVVGAVIGAFSGGINVADLGSEVTDVVPAIAGGAVIRLLAGEARGALIAGITFTVDAVTSCAVIGLIAWQADTLVIGITLHMSGWGLAQTTSIPITATGVCCSAA